MNEILTLKSNKDTLFEQQPWPDPFVFNEAVAAVFDDMAVRSIPLYREAIICAARWAGDYYQADTHIIDVGCSTGTLFSLLGRLLPASASLIGIDSSKPMLEKAAQKLVDMAQKHQLTFWHKDILNCAFDDSSVVVMNYTLQFLPVTQRALVIQAIYDGLAPNGLLFLSEKVKSISPEIQARTTRHYEAFKAQNGYAHTEIERKKAALSNVLVPLTTAEQVAMLQSAGFRTIDTVLKMHNFTSFVAVK